jgi:hypothetical protein
MMQAQTRKPASFELADRRLIETCERLHLALGQARPPSPFIGFGPDPDKLLGDLGLERPRFSIHDRH